MDLLDILDFAAMAVGETRWRRYGLIVDVSYVSLSAGGTTRGPLFSSVELELDAFVSTIAGAYWVVEENRAHLAGEARLVIIQELYHLALGDRHPDISQQGQGAPSRNMKIPSPVQVDMDRTTRSNDRLSVRKRCFKCP